MGRVNIASESKPIEGRSEFPRRKAIPELYGESWIT
jgi:hypothetical protein